MITIVRQAENPRGEQSGCRPQCLGPKRRKALWAHFNSLEAMKEASIDELAKVESMNYKTAEMLYNFFRMSKVEKQEILK